MASSRRRYLPGRSSDFSGRPQFMNIARLFRIPTDEAVSLFYCFIAAEQAYLINKIYRCRNYGNLRKSTHEVPRLRFVVFLPVAIPDLIWRRKTEYPLDFRGRHLSLDGVLRSRGEPGAHAAHRLIGGARHPVFSGLCTGSGLLGLSLGGDDWSEPNSFWRS